MSCGNIAAAHRDAAPAWFDCRVPTQATPCVLAFAAAISAGDIGIAVWIAFAVDYFVRLTLSVPRGAFVRTHKLDLLMVLLPFLRIVRVVIIIVRWKADRHGPS